MTISHRTVAVVALVVLAALPARLLAADREEAQFNVAVSLYNAGQWQAALRHIQKREKQTLSDPMRARYLYVKGLCYERGDKPDQAHAAYRELLGKHPKAGEAAKARVALVYLDYARQDNAAVIAGYPGVDLKPLDEAGKRNLTLMYAEALRANGNDAPAIQAYAQALKLGADEAAVRPKLFDLYLRAGDHRQVLAVSAKGVAGVDAALVALARAEAHLALNRPADAEPEAAKVPKGHVQYARAAHARARALIGLKRHKDAIPWLEVAAAELADLPARAAASLVRVECELETGDAPRAEAALDQARKRVASLPQADRPAFAGHLALLDLRLASAAGDGKRLIEAVQRAREHVPAGELPKVLYMRLYALSQGNDTKGVLATMPTDYPLLQKTDQDGRASFIYHRALKSAGRDDESRAVLDGLIERQPRSNDAVHAHLALANGRLSEKAYDEAAPHLAAIVAAPQAKQILTARVYQEVLCNRGVVALKAGDAKTAVDALSKAVAEKPENDLLTTALQLLGQAHLDGKDHAGAVKAWEQALAVAAEKDRPALRDRLARVHFVQGQHEAAVGQFAAMAEAKGGDGSPDRESLEMWARSLFMLKRYGEAAAKYRRLYDRHGKSASQAYELAVALQSADEVAEAAKWFGVAMKGAKALPQAYAQAVDANHAEALLKSKTGDLGRGYWLRGLAAGQSEEVFGRAVAALIDIVDAGRRDKALAKALTRALASSPPDSARHYSLGAVLLHTLAADGDNRELARLAVELTEALAEHEGKLDASAHGATAGAAMIHYYAGEAARRDDRPADALASYETVLSVYPYNEWPDAAAYGTAQCFVAFDDKQTARTRLKEIVDADGASPAWREKARELMTTLEKGE